MEQRIAFIGIGAMGGAILKAACQAVRPALITITDYDNTKATQLARELGVNAVASNSEAVRGADFVFLCVKPNGVEDVLREISDALTAAEKPPVLCSILAGVTVLRMRELIGAPDYPVIRIMPNTPVLVGRGIMLLACDERIFPAQQAAFEEIVRASSKLYWMDETKIDAATALTGSSPAFVYQFIEAMADAAVEAGIGRALAMELAAGAVEGSARMVLETGIHPAALKDMVTSPGGATIAGTNALEEAGMRNAVIQAMRATHKRTMELGK